MAWLSSSSTTDHASWAPDPASRQRLPQSAGRFGMILFLVSLGILFAASLLGFLIIRFGGLVQLSAPGSAQANAPTVPGLGQIHLPTTLWLSTGVILISSMTIHRALESVRLERQKRFRQSLVLTLVLAGGFLLIQTPGLVSLLSERYTGQITAIYGLIFTLVLIHALHVIGGVIPLAVITHHAHKGRYDHEVHQPVSHMVMYWHFLDAVWLIMFATLLIGR